MRGKIFKPLFLCLVIIVSMSTLYSDCDDETDKADLRPIDHLGYDMYCDLDSEGNLVVHVENRGNADASSVKVTVTFTLLSGSSSVSGTISSIAAGTTETVPISIPAGCYNPDCFFNINVDPDDTIDESNESNNTADGYCIG